jgi:hypothetical protein
MLALDQAVPLQPQQMLAGACRRHAEPRSDGGSGLRTAHLELEQDSIVAGSRHCCLTLGFGGGQFGN